MVGGGNGREKCGYIIIAFLSNWKGGLYIAQYYVTLILSGISINLVRQAKAICTLSMCNERTKHGQKCTITKVVCQKTYVP